MADDDDDDDRKEYVLTLVFDRPSACESLSSSKTSWKRAPTRRQGITKFGQPPMPVWLEQDDAGERTMCWWSAVVNGWIHVVVEDNTSRTTMTKYYAIVQAYIQDRGSHSAAFARAVAEVRNFSTSRSEVEDVPEHGGGAGDSLMRPTSTGKRRLALSADDRALTTKTIDSSSSDEDDMPLSKRAAFTKTTPGNWCKVRYHVIKRGIGLYWSGLLTRNTRPPLPSNGAVTGGAGVSDVVPSTSGFVKCSYCKGRKQFKGLACNLPCAGGYTPTTCTHCYGYDFRVRKSALPPCMRGGKVCYHGRKPAGSSSAALLVWGSIGVRC